MFNHGLEKLFRDVFYFFQAFDGNIVASAGKDFGWVGVEWNQFDLVVLENDYFGVCLSDIYSEDRTFETVHYFDAAFGFSGV